MGHGLRLVPHFHPCEPQGDNQRKCNPHKPRSFPFGAPYCSCALTMTVAHDLLTSSSNDMSPKSPLMQTFWIFNRERGSGNVRRRRFSLAPSSQQTISCLRSSEFVHELFRPWFPVSYRGVSISAKQSKPGPLVIDSKEPAAVIGGGAVPVPHEASFLSQCHQKRRLYLVPVFDHPLSMGPHVVSPSPYCALAGCAGHVGN